MLKKYLIYEYLIYDYHKKNTWFALKVKYNQTHAIAPNSSRT